MSADEGSGALAAIARSLEANPVFAMSLGSKELFHSNLIAWFLQHHRPVAEALGMRGEVAVLREKNHTDLLIRHGQQQVTLIENKVFALPDTGQLARLAGGPAAAAAELVLLSLTSPSWPDGTWAGPGGRSWTWLSYRQLGERLRPALSRSRRPMPMPGRRWSDGLTISPSSRTWPGLRDGRHRRSR